MWSTYNVSICTDQLKQVPWTNKSKTSCACNKLSVNTQFTSNTGLASVGTYFVVMLKCAAQVCC